VSWLLCAFVLAFAFGAAQSPAETTIYVGKHFEVREHDAPVKYVFNGSTRVARVTGSLSPNERIQRLRLRAGWNLVSLAVTAPDFLDQLGEFTSGPAPVIRDFYRWQPTTSGYGAITSGESVPAGTVLWVSAQADAVVAVRGGYVEPSQWGVPGGATFVAVPALEAQPLQLPAEVTIWRYDAPNRRWQAGLTGDLSSVSDLPSTLGPGEAIYVHANEPTDLGAPAPEERIRYYHQDHLGSSSALTDASGVVVEETAFYPFGIPRHEHRFRQVEEPYTFTQKERDRESGLHHFEARYLAGAMSRFLSVDPLYAQLEAAPSGSQQLNLYAYTRSNPLRYVDPTGMEDENAWWDPLGLTGVSESDSANFGMGLGDGSQAIPFWGLIREEVVAANPGVIATDSTAYEAGDATGTAAMLAVSLGPLVARGIGGLIALGRGGGSVGGTAIAGGEAATAGKSAVNQFGKTSLAAPKPAVKAGVGTVESVSEAALFRANAANQAAIRAAELEAGRYFGEIGKITSALHKQALATGLPLTPDKLQTYFTTAQRFVDAARRVP
jgi:RHS repeat-associated protein